MDIPFNRPAVNERTLAYLGDVVGGRHLAGDGGFTVRCHALIAAATGGHALLTHSGTAALELAALLARIGPGDEVIMPSFTFSSTANAVVLRGASPVFVDIREDTLNIDETIVAEAVNRSTKAILPVHYAGICAEMEAICTIASENGLFVFEDAAQAYRSTYKGRPAGMLSSAGAFSFHETKNVVSGEGGALVVHDVELFERAEIIREKGTDRRQFLRGAVDKYTWRDVGSSYLPSELIAAALLAQLEDAEDLTAYRLSCFAAYAEGFAEAAARERVRLPVVPPHCVGNGHMFYLLLQNAEDRAGFIAHMAGNGIRTAFHYVPLHSAEAGRRFGRVHGPMAQTDRQSARLVRLPLYHGVREHLPRIVDAALSYLNR